jgi:tetratricopeptide (TPR) repeat protein
VGYLRGDHQQARASAEEALSVARSLGDPVAIHSALANLANSRGADGLLDESFALEEEALELARELRLERPRRLLGALTNVGYTAFVRGRSDDAVRFTEEAIALAEQLGESVDAAIARCNLAIAVLDLGRIEEAGRLAAEATVAAIATSNRLLGTACLEVLAGVEVERGNHRFAARLLGTAETVRRALGYELETAERALHDRVTERVRGVLGESRLAKEWAKGAESDIEQAFASIGREFLA